MLSTSPQLVQWVSGLGGVGIVYAVRWFMMSTLLVLGDMLLSSLLLDPLSAIAYGEVAIFLIKWGFVALIAVILLVGFILVMRLDRESTLEEPAQSTQKEPVQTRGEDYFQVIVMAIVAVIVFGIWIL